MSYSKNLNDFLSPVGLNPSSSAWIQTLGTYLNLAFQSHLPQFPFKHSDYLPKLILANGISPAGISTLPPTSPLVQSSPIFSSLIQMHPLLKTFSQQHLTTNMSANKFPVFSILIFSPTVVFISVSLTHCPRMAASELLASMIAQMLSASPEVLRV